MGTRVMKKLENISFIKTIMMVLIVFYHSILILDPEWFPRATTTNNNGLSYLAKWLNTFHIQTFAMASGYLFYYLKIEYNKYSDIKKDILVRAKRLLIPYLSTCIFWVIPITSYFFGYSLEDIFYKYILMTSPSQLWFLIMLFWNFVFFLLFSDKIKISFKNYIYIYIITTIIGYGLSHYNINYFLISKSIKYILFFYLGGLIYQNKNHITFKQIKYIMFVSLCLLVSCFFIENNKNIENLSAFIYPILSSFEVIVIYYFGSKFVKINKYKNKTYNLLESNSFGIYLFHQQILYIVISIIDKSIHPILMVLISFTIAMVGSLIMAFVLKRNKITAFLFGLK